MTALEIIKKSAIMLNVAEILEDKTLLSVTNENSAEILDNNFALNRMFEILKILLSDVAYQIQPIENQEKCETIEKQIDLADFKNLIKITKVQKDGVSVKFSLKNGKIVLPFDAMFDISYTSYISIDNLVSEIDLSSVNVHSDVLVYGLTAFYCLAVGLFEEFNIYNTIYNDKVVANKKMKIIEMPNRRWE